MFTWNCLKSRKPTEMVGFRKFSTDYGHNFNLHNISAQKKFHNPNFVNKQNPNLLNCQTNQPQNYCPGSSAMRIPDEIGVDSLSELKMSSSPICIAVCAPASTEFTVSITPESFGRKTRLNSDCPSEDSFVVFDYDSDCENDTGNFESEICSSDDESETDESDVDQVDFVKKIPYKKVRFSDKPCVVHKMVKWAFAYRSARKGHWEELARDRCRFKDRISKLEEVISPVLKVEHRDKIYNERFRNLEN